ncbi:hypothetical protein M404DRAFT_29533 [Pisolithus tinctorius Marx 270]|uniref:Uncharacterized protein n=1 Tax=Pisolithus tinctorius Marx 270 TaxID=870435 RepID=A0A0C3JSE2_PISTI|nr:hypothetical protein M404DRAFT_29533 [Pisolithus tinctorius Marx 270]
MRYRTTISIPRFSRSGVYFPRFSDPLLRDRDGFNATPEAHLIAVLASINDEGILRVSGSGRDMLSFDRLLDGWPKPLCDLCFPREFASCLLLGNPF